MIDFSKLKNAVDKSGKTVAQCPACAANGADTKGDHLVIFEDGKFGCVVNPDDKEHNRQILKLAGKGGSAPRVSVPIERLHIPDSKVLFKFGRIGREPVSRLTSNDGGRDKAVSATPAELCGSKGTNHGVNLEEAEAFLQELPA